MRITKSVMVFTCLVQSLPAFSAETELLCDYVIGTTPDNFIVTLDTDKKTASWTLLRKDFVGDLKIEDKYYRARPDDANAININRMSGELTFQYKTMWLDGSCKKYEGPLL